MLNCVFLSLHDLYGFIQGLRIEKYRHLKNKGKYQTRISSPVESSAIQVMVHLTSMLRYETKEKIILLLALHFSL